MTYQTYAEFNQSGLTALFLYAASISPIFVSLMLFTLFIIVLMGTYFAQLRTQGYASLISSFIAAAFFQFIIAIMMTLTPGLINLTTLAVSFTVLVVAVIILFFSSKN